MDARGAHNNQVRYWTLSYYLKMIVEGFDILFSEYKRVFKDQYKRLKNCFQDRQEDSSEMDDVFDATGTCKLVNQDEQLSSILYGAHVMSRLLVCISLWIPSFIADIRHGTQVSRLFVVVSYSVAVVGLVLGITLARVVVEPSLTYILPGLIKNVYYLISLLIQMVEIGYITFAMFSLAYLVFHRNFIQDFFLFHSSMLTLPKSYQRRTIWSIFSVSFFVTIMSEPLFVVMALFQDINQPAFFPHLDRSQFLITKLLLVAVMAFLALLVSFLSIMVPTLSRFLIVGTAKYLDISFHKQIIRLRQANSHHDQRQHPTQLVALVDRVTSDTIKDFSCDSLTLDWPPFRPPHDCEGYQLELDQEHKSCPLNGLNNHHLASKNQNKRPTSSSNNNRRSSSCGALMFLYKNLVRSLSELKGMIEIYERRFGLFHVVLICLQGMIVAQWVVAGLTQARLIADTINKGGQSDQIIASISGFKVTPFTFRVGIGIVVFVVSNLHVFLLCDRLPHQVLKMQNQLFKVNVNLALSNLYAPLVVRTKKRKRPPKSTLHVYHNHQATPNGFEWTELDQVWSLYDQFVRMGRKTNFKLTPNTFYNKNCLLTIFGREISLVLLYIQVIDISSHI